MEELIKEVKKVIEKWVKERKRYIPKIDEKKFEGHGVFVTITKKGNLRGCIGFPRPFKGFKNDLMEAAISACHDPRFEPLKEDELKDIEVEITLLGPLKKLEVSSPKEYLEKIKIGKHGIMIVRGPYSGLLLPQVAVENNWDVFEFLCNACIKAGLDPLAWMDKRTEVYIFEGKVVKKGD